MSFMFETFPKLNKLAEKNMWFLCSTVQMEEGKTEFKSKLSFI